MKETKVNIGIILLVVIHFLILNVISNLDIFITLSDVQYYSLMYGMVIFIAILSILLFVKSGKGRVYGKFHFRWTYLGALFLSLILFFIWSYMTSLIFPMTRNGTAVLQDAAALTGPAYILVRMIAPIIVAPFQEEFLYRGLVMTALERYKSFGLDLLVSSSLFSLTHVLQHGWVTSDFVLYFGTGIILGALFRYTRSIYWSIVAHVLWNTFVVVVGILVFGY